MGRDELGKFGVERLAELLAERISALPYHEQKRWAARHLPRGLPSQELVSFISAVEPTIPLVFIRPGLVRTFAGRPAERLDLLEDVRRAQCCGRFRSGSSSLPI